MKIGTITVIIGKRSNLSMQLEKNIEKSVLISTSLIEKEIKEINLSRYDSVNIVFNQFQQSTKLYSLEEPLLYVTKSISSTAYVLDFIKKNKIKINKIIYTSSSSVYGNSTHCTEENNVNPKSLHASLKISNEKLIEFFCNENNINLEIVYYPSAIDILNDNKDTEKSNHFNLLKNWSFFEGIFFFRLGALCLV